MCGGNSKATVNESATDSNPPVPVKTDVKYFLTIKTSNQNRNGINGPISTKIIGDERKQTKEWILTSQTIPNDSKIDFEFNGDDVGKPQEICLFYGKTKRKWTIEFVELSVNDVDVLQRFYPIDSSKTNEKSFVELRSFDEPSQKSQIRIDVDGRTENDESTFFLKLVGTKGETSTFHIDPTTIVDGKINVPLTHRNVGELQKLVLGLETENEEETFHVNNVRIIVDGKESVFVVEKTFGGNGKDRLMSVELTPNEPLNSVYFVKIRTGDVEIESNVKDFLQFSLNGSKGQLKRIFLKDFLQSKDKTSFERGTTDEFEIPHDDIGKIESLTIGFDGETTKLVWLLESIEIRYKDERYHFQVNSWLSTRLGSAFSWLNVNTEPKMNYQIIVETGPKELNGNVFLCISGDDRTTSDLALIPSKGIFPQQTRLEFNLADVDVGKINKINVGHDGKDQQWILKSVEIIKNNENYLFSANCCLNSSISNNVDLSPDQPNEKIYTIIVTTHSQNDAGTDSGVFLRIIGENDESKRIHLIKTKNGEDATFRPASVNVFEVKMKDVGRIKKINIGHDGKGLQPSWFLQTVEIQKDAEIYRFTADSILDLSMQYTDLIPMPSRKPSNRPSTPLTKPMPNISYEISLQAVPNRQGSIGENANLYLILVNEKGEESETIRLKRDSKTNKIYQKYEGNDLGEISRVILGQKPNENRIIWKVFNIVIRYKNQEFTYTDERIIAQGSRHDLTLSTSAKTSEIQYEIKTTTGNESFQGKVILHLYGEGNSLAIPLTSPKSAEIPFRIKAVDEFSHQDRNIGRIRKIVIEHDGTSRENPLNLKKIQIFKGRRIYEFNSTIRVDDPQRKLTLYPIPQRKEDYVESQLRKLRETLRNESAKRRRPAPKAYQPYVYNDLNPYYDTTTVEKAIYEPLDSTTGYYTRLTALRIVEPWEAYGMDYGVSYELVKPTGSAARSRSAKRSPKPSQMGMMILPPVSFPFGGQVTYINSARLENPSNQRSPLSTTREN